MKYGAGDSAPRDERYIISKRDLVKQLTELQYNLSYTENDTKEAVFVVAVERNVTWQLSDEKLSDWCKNHAARLRTMLRHVQQARCRRTPPAWLEELDLPIWERRGAQEGPEPSADEGRKPSILFSMLFLITKKCAIINHCC